MMERILYTGNEIILTQDQNNNGDHYITNQDVIAGTYGATTIIKGMETVEADIPDMTVRVKAGYANDFTVENFLVGDGGAGINILTINPSDVSQDRRDIIEMRRLKLDTTPESRNFKDPNTQAISQDTVETVQEYKTEYKVLAGIPGSIAIAVEPNWVKIAEILVPASSISVLDTNIYNVDAVAEGDDNTNWTNNADSIFRLGTFSDVNNKIRTKGINVSGGATIIPGSRDLSIIGDVSLGDATITLNAPLFLGQKVHIKADGSGILTVDGGNGIYVNGIFVTENTGGARAEAVSDGAGGYDWAFVDEVTLYMISSGFVTKKRSSGTMEQTYEASDTINGQAQGSIYVSFTDLIPQIARPFSFTDIEESAHSVDPGSSNFLWMVARLGTGISVTPALRIGGIDAFNVFVTVRTTQKGKY